MFILRIFSRIYINYKDLYNRYLIFLYIPNKTKGSRGDIYNSKLPAGGYQPAYVINMNLTTSGANNPSEAYQTFSYDCSFRKSKGS